MQYYRLILSCFDIDKSLSLAYRSWTIKDLEVIATKKIKPDQTLLYVEAAPLAIIDIQKEFDWINSIIPVSEKEINSKYPSFTSQISKKY